MNRVKCIVQVDNEEPEMIKVEDISASFWARFIDAHKVLRVHSILSKITVIICGVNCPR